MKLKIEKHKSVTKSANAAGGESFIPDAAHRLINRIGNPNFNEPNYYENSAKSSALNPVAQAIVNDAQELAAKSPELLLALAWWSRVEMKVRTTPVVLLAVASRIDESRKFIRTYAPKIITRADQIKELWSSYQFLWGEDFCITFKRMIADLFSYFREEDFLKYNSKEFPTFADILRMTNFGIRKSNGKRKILLSKEIKDYLIYGKVSKNTPIIYNRYLFSLCTNFAAAQKYAILSKANWEVVVSKFGNTKEVWEFLLKNNLVGYMALLRNLRNILNTQLDDNILDDVCAKIISGAADSKQMPYAFLTAKSAIEGNMGRSKQDYNPLNHQVLKVNRALEQAIIEVINTIPKFSGTTAIFIDNSGSMSSSISRDSSLSCEQAAAMLGSLLCTQNHRLFAFGTDVAEVKVSGNFLDLAKKIKEADTKGMSTNGYRCIQLLRQKNIKVNRIVIISDMETYGGSLNDELKKYRKEIGDCWVYFINVQGSSQGGSPAKGTKMLNLSGHSEKALINAIEAEETAKEEGISVNLILDLIKSKYLI